MSRKRRSAANGDRPIHRKPGRPRAERIFYVAVEGEATEPEYLDYLNKEFGERHRFSIKPLSQSNGGLKPREVVARVAEHLDDVKEFSAKLWAMFDRDEHTGVPEAFKEAEEADIRVAFSNPSFDLWLLLHLSDFSGAQGGSSDIVHEKLKKHDAFRTFGPKDKRLASSRKDALRGREKDAADRARRLARDCTTNGCSARGGHVGRCPRIARDPYTEVWELLVELGIIPR